MSSNDLGANNTTGARDSKHLPAAAVARTVDACAYLNVSRATLYRLVRAGKIKPIPLGARARGYSYRDLDAFLASAAA